MVQERRYGVGEQCFTKIREEGCVYVDKTALLHRLVNRYSYVFLSRPRRFGKSLLVDTLDQYFRGRRELFRGLAVDGLETEWAEYPVVRLSLDGVMDGDVSAFEEQMLDEMASVEREYGVECSSATLGVHFSQLVKWLSAKTGRKVVILIDEYDAPLLNVIDDPERMETMRKAVRGLFSSVKRLSGHIRFFFLTGITKFSQLSIFSELNNLKNISMDRAFHDICGITQEEMDTQLRLDVEGLAAAVGKSYDEVRTELKRRYDGYHFVQGASNLYNPYSLINAFDSQSLDDFWFSTATPSFLVKVLRRFDVSLETLDGSEVFKEEFDAPTVDMHSAIPLLYQSGYLTIKGYDPDGDIYTLGYPNEEVRRGFIRGMVPYYIGGGDSASNLLVVKMGRLIVSGDMGGALSLLRTFLSSVPYQEGATSEGHFTSVLYIIFTLLGFRVETQVRTAVGRLDIVVRTRSDIYVMELKIGQSAETALAQIDSKDYMVAYSHEGLAMHKVGISFDMKTRTLGEWKMV